MGNNQGTTFNDQMIEEFSSLSGLSEKQVAVDSRHSLQTTTGDVRTSLLGPRGVRGLAVSTSKGENGEEMF